MGPAWRRARCRPGGPSAGPAGQDWIAFLMDTERRFLGTMREYLKNDLGLHALVSRTQASYGGLGGALREEASDYTDMHAYWQHPRFPRRPWDPADWTVGTARLTADPRGGALASLARYRLAGRPFVVSEFNIPAPADCVAILEARLLQTCEFSADHALLVAAVTWGELRADAAPFTHVRGNGFSY